MFRACAAMVCLFTVVAPVPAAEEKPTPPAFVVRVRSLKALREDSNWIDRLTRGAEAAKRFDDEITESFGKDHAGLDIDKPAGIYGSFGGNIVPELVFVLPLKNAKSFLEKMRKWYGNFNEDENDKGLYHLSGGWFTPRTMRVTGDHAYFTWMQAELLAKNKLPNPEKLFASDLPATLSVVMHMDRVPDAMKKVGLDEVQRIVERVTVRTPGESDLQHALRSRVMASVNAWVGDAAREGDRIEFQVGVDRKAEEFFVQLDVRAKAKTKLSAAIEKLGESQSRFAGRPRDREAIGLQLRWDLPDDLKPVVRPVVDEAIRRAMQHAAAETVREHAAKLTRALAPTLEPGELDAAFSLVGPAAGTRHYTLLAGFKVREGRALDEAVRGLVKSLPERDRAKFRFDIATVNRTPLHRADLQYDFEDLLAPLCGKHPAYFAVTEDSAWVALGPEGQEVLKKAMAAPAGRSPLLDYEVSFARLLPLAAANLNGNVAEMQKVADRIARKNDGSDKLRFTLEGGNSLRGRFSVKAGGLEMIRVMNPDQQWSLHWLFR